ncbi:MAG TPA: hypothetical protein VFG20_15480 [Planctomycetaceae bacterium]|nr:hypothetical protein [Planctomycetaceae bacterium]
MIPSVTRWSLAMARFCTAAWIGAAVLFVIVGVREVITPDFSSEVRDRLVAIRFPAYYIAGATLTGMAFLASAVAAMQSSSRGIRLALAALAIAGALMAFDYVRIYSPLVAMITPPGQPRTAAFVTLHKSSMRINTAHLAACLVAAIALSATDGRRNDAPTV